MTVINKTKVGLIIGCFSLLLSACNTTNDNSSSAKATQSAPSHNPLTTQRIYGDREFSADYFGRIRWLADGSGYTAVEKSSAKKTDKNGKEVSIGKDIVFYDPATSKRKVLITAKQLTPDNADESLSIDNYIWSDDRKKLLIYTNSKRVWRSKSRGDYWLLNIDTNKLSKIGSKEAPESSLMFAKFSSNGNNVAYVRHNNIYVQHLSSMAVEQLTFDASDHIINGNFDWVYEEEFSIRDGFRWSPDGKKIAYWQLDTSRSQDFTMINNTDSLYPKTTTFPYPKVGEDNAIVKIGIVSLASKKSTWAQLTDINDMYIPRMSWAGNSEQVLIQHVNRKQDKNQLYYANANTGELTKVFLEQEENFLESYRDPEWIDNSKAFVWQSERDGWRHLYRITRDGKQSINLTPGDFDIISIQSIDEKNGWIYFIASPKNPAQRYLFRSKLDGSVMEKITPENYAGANTYQISEDASWAIHTHSSFDQPAQKRLISLPDHAIKQELYDNKKLANQLAKLSLAKTEFFQVKAQDGLALDGYIMRPDNFDASKKYPIIFFVYGYPSGQTVHDKFGGSGYLWSQMMTQQGYIVASIDNRGTGVPKGKAWRESIYGAVGILGSRDQSDALKAMAKRWSYIDTSRVGIWGWSGGGSTTLDMMFRYPDQYHVGVSVAALSDQRLYDTIYQERYSGLLKDNAEGYEQGSAVTHAQNLKGKLLIVHGTGDDNVHYQIAEKLINKLVEHNKQFDLMSYPNRSHGIYEGKGTSLHLRTMMSEYFKEHL